MSPRRWLLGALLLLWCRDANAGQPPPRGTEAETGWLEIGSFQGSMASGWLGRINNWLFEYERDDSLFQDLGNLGVGVGFDIGHVAIDWDNYFRRRVVRAHEELPAGSTVGEGDLSGYQGLSRARTRLRLSWDYLPDLVGEVGVGVEVEGGYSLAMAFTERARMTSERAFEPYTRAKAGEELKKFFHEHDLSLKSDVIDLAFGSAAALVDKATGEIGERYADTEKAAIFYDGYAEPMTYITTAHMPPSPLLFTEEDSPLAVGDALTFTTFVGFSPLRAGFGETGVRASFKRFRRWIRETTIFKETRDTVLVRVRKLRWDGNELIPFKLRPEIRFLAVVKLGYTFFEVKREAFDEVVSDQTYRVDLRSDSGRRFLETVMEEATEAQRVPKPVVIEDHDGVETLSAEFRSGETRDRRMQARISSWLGFRENHISSIQQIRTQDAELQEVIRARIQELRKPFGRRRRYDIRSVITIQSDLRWREETLSQRLRGGDALAATIETSFSSPWARGVDLRSLGRDLEMIVGVEELPEEFTPLRGLPAEEVRAMTFNLRLSFGPEQIERLEQVKEDELWATLGELLLGPQLGGAWTSKTKRFWWMPTERAHGRAHFQQPHISQRYDELRGFPRQKQTVLGLAPDRRGSRELFIMAAHTVRKFKKLQRQIRQGNCLTCMADLFAKASDVVLLQSLLVHFAGGVELGEVGLEAEVFSDDMPAPARVSNGVTHTYGHKRGAEIVEDVELSRDAEPRLRAGSVFLNVGKSAGEGTTERSDPCWQLRLYSDFFFEERMPLRVYLREVRPRTDREIQISTLDLGEPHALPQAPFMVARYYYDVPLPWPGLLEAHRDYSVLLRVINSQGLPVTEEQEIRLQLPGDWLERVPEKCLPRELVATSDQQSAPAGL